MAGKPGRSGRVKDAAHHRAKQLAGRKGGMAKAGHGGKVSLPKWDGVSVTDPAEVIKLLPGANPYDEVVLRTGGEFSYLDGKTREQVRGEELSNEKSRVALEKERGQLLSADEVEARDERREEIFTRHLRAVVDLVPELVPPELMQSARMKASAWVDDRLAQIAQEVAEA